MTGRDEIAVDHRFTIKQVIGAGGFGVVYRAHDAEMGVDVALKVLRSTTGPSIYLFKKEFRSLADLVHPNLINLHELQSRGDMWFSRWI